ncbi:primosomal protein N' [bacterium]|nr:primosomal protein N' [bacterium]
MPEYVSIAFEANLDTHYTYRVPESLREGARMGTRVMAPLGKTQRVGYIVKEDSEIPKGIELKEISSLVDKVAMITPPLMKLAIFVSDYYFCGLGQALRCFLPAPVRHRATDLGLVHVVKIKRSPEELEELYKKVAERFWKKRNLLRCLMLKAASPDQKSPLLLQELRERAECDLASVRAIEKQGIIEIALEKHWSLRDDEAALPNIPPELTEDQKAAVEKVLEKKNEFGAFLLHGVTGSGKTEVYLHIIAEALKANKTAIVLVPEIALTPQTADRFRGRFGSKVAVLHSAQSDKERHNQWWRIREGHARVVVGARSAIFSPVSDLGCVIVDEEHEGSYKQNGEAPYYNARDLAVMRAKLENCPVVLGSATPSLESVRNVQLGKYTLLNLKKRVCASADIETELVDLNQEVLAAPQFGLVSRSLKTALADCLEKREQAILFLNRRGYVPRLICPECYETLKCPSCSVPLAYHKRDNLLKCHLCGYTEEYLPPYKCPECGVNLKPAGYGTQRVENLLHAMFPEAKIGRMDRDTTSKRGAHEKILGDFAAHEFDILLGTQMIAKGLDFHNVTLVGVLNADISLNTPDFRSGERTFQLVTQVVGRSGRGAKAGKSIVQSYTPEASVLRCAVGGDWEGFVKKEMEERREFNYPPFSHIIEIIFRSKDSKKAYAAADKARKKIAALSDGMAGYFYLTEVEEAYPAFAFNEYRWQIHMRVSSVPRAMETLIRPAKNFLKSTSNVKCQVDVDPV